MTDCGQFKPVSWSSFRSSFGWLSNWLLVADRGADAAALLTPTRNASWETPPWDRTPDVAGTVATIRSAGDLFAGSGLLNQMHTRFVRSSRVSLLICITDIVDYSAAPATNVTKIAWISYSAVLGYQPAGYWLTKKKSSMSLLGHAISNEEGILGS